MAWARIEDCMKDHPKILAAGPLLELIQYRALQYANRFLTDGFVPFAALPALAVGLEALGLPVDWPAAMVRARLWSGRRGGFVVHDFLEWNLSRNEVLAARKQKSKAGKKGASVTNSRRSTSAGAASHAEAPDASSDAAPDAAHGRQYPLTTKSKKEPVANGRRNVTGSATPVPTGSTNGFHSSQASNESPPDHPHVGALIQAVAEQAGYDFERDARAPARGTYEAIEARIRENFPNLTREQFSQRVLTEFAQRLEARR